MGIAGGAVVAGVSGVSVMSEGDAGVSIVVVMGVSVVAEISVVAGVSMFGNGGKVGNGGYLESGGNPSGNSPSQL